MENTIVAPSLELGLQELEPMEAPGWATAAGITVGVISTASLAYGGWALSVALVAT